MVNEKMTALADEIRELSGTTTPKSLDTMASDVNTANVEISNQTDLLAQAFAALEGKTSGAANTILAGQSVTINASNANIEAIINTVDSSGKLGIYIITPTALPMGSTTLYRFMPDNALAGSAIVVLDGNARPLSNGTIIKQTDTYTVIQVGEGDKLS